MELCLITLFLSCTVVRHSDIGGTTAVAKDGVTFGDSSFDAKQYVEDIWEPKVLPLIEEKAVDLGVLFKELEENPDSACKKYGYCVGNEGSNYNFSGEGKVKVISVNTESRNGILNVDVEPYDGNPDFILQIGPVFKGTAMRDYLNFISINDFLNQVSYAKLGTELNMKVRDTIVNGIDFSSKEGNEFYVSVVFPLNKDSEGIKAVPVKIKSVEE
ncbi:MAG: DUF2291 domain-containing protein [Treponema sp.]|nr:DUF2291 domain-containing protein [Treponema sp.]